MRSRVTMHTCGGRTAASACRGRIRWLLYLMIVVATATTPLSAKRKDDILVLVNGDRLVGEIRELAQGELHFKTDYILNEFHVDWKQVQQLESEDLFRVAVKDGRRSIGKIARHPDGGFTVTNGASVVTFLWSDVIGLLPVETGFWAQLRGQISSGSSYTSGDSQSQLSASGSVAYVGDRYAFDLSGSSSFSGHSGSDDSNTKRNVADVVHEFGIGRQWFGPEKSKIFENFTQPLFARLPAHSKPCAVTAASP